MITEHTWLECNQKLIAQDDVEKGESIAWAAYHAAHCDIDNCTVPTITQLMPLFYEKAATAAILKHRMTVQQKVIIFLNHYFAREP